MFGIYLTYALYFVQPENYVAQVRVTPDQMADLTDFINERLIPERHVDAFTALFKLINGGAFRIIAFEKEVIVSSVYKKDNGFSKKNGFCHYRYFLLKAWFLISLVLSLLKIRQ